MMRFRALAVAASRKWLTLKLRRRFGAEFIHGRAVSSGFFLAFMMSGSFT